MINFHYVTLRNFMSFGNQESTFNLSGEGATLITGKNADDTSDGEAANGVGKTCLLNAITFALYARPVTDITTLDKLINNINKRNMVVSIVFEKEGFFYKVVRARKLKGKGASYIEIYKSSSIDQFDDEHIITVAGSPNEQIEKIIGISYELFVRIVLFTADRNSFFDLPEKAPSKGKASQTSIIETLFGLTEISEKADILKDQIKENNSDLKSLTLIQQQTLDEIERHDIQLQNAEKRVSKWYDDQKIKIANVEEEIQMLSNVDIDHQKELIGEYQAAISEINNLKNSDYYNSLSRQAELTKSLTKLHKDIGHLEDDNCPFCNQKFSGSKEKLTEYEALQTKELDELESLTLQIEETNMEIKKHQAVCDALEKDMLVTSFEEINQLEKERLQINSRLEHLRNESNPHEEALTELKNMVLPEPKTDELEKLSKHVKHQQFLHKLLTKKDSFIRAVLLDKNIPFLNNRLTTYVTSLGLPHKIQFTHQLNIQITKLGEPLDFGNLSTGQRARVNLALSLAFRDVLQKLHTPINLCIFDEVLDLGLDSVGVQLAVKLLKRKARSEKTKLYIISHREEITGSFSDNLKIIFSQGFSYIGEQK